MNEYIPVSERKPSEDMLCLVCNEKGWMANIPAIYHAHYDVFVLNESNSRQSLTLEVTHWFPYPSPVSLKGSK